jgi:hypothetical protein
MKQGSLLLVFLLFLFSTYGQVAKSYEASMDSLKKKFLQDSIHNYRFKKWRPYLSYDQRNSFIKKLPVSYRGVQVGCIYRDAQILGLGAYEIIQKAKNGITTTDNQNNTIGLNIYLKYSTLFYQYRLVNKRYYEVDIPLELGAGTSYIRLQNPNGLLINNLNKPIFPIGGGLQLILRPTKWFGVSIMGGYRYVGETYKDLNFNGSYYSIGVWVDVRQVYRDIYFYGFIKRKYKKSMALLKTAND